MTTVTQWFDGMEKPVYAGAYEVEAYSGGERKYAWWNGRQWFIPHFSPLGAKGFAGFETPIQNRKWRGLAEKPQP